MSDLMVLSLALVVCFALMAWCVRGVTSAIPRILAQAEQGLEQQRTQTNRFADALLAQGDAQALLTLTQARSVPDAQRGEVPDLQANGEIGEKLRSVRNALSAQAADKLRVKIEELQGSEGVMSGPGHHEEA